MAKLQRSLQKYVRYTALARLGSRAEPAARAPISHALPCTLARRAAGGLGDPVQLLLRDGGPAARPRGWCLSLAGLRVLGLGDLPREAAPFSSRLPSPQGSSRSIDTCTKPASARLSRHFFENTRKSLFLNVMLRFRYGVCQRNPHLRFTDKWIFTDEYTFVSGLFSRIIIVLKFDHTVLLAL